MNLIKDYIGYFLCQKCLKAPIFIVGSGRSGTSILLQALGKHEKILAFPGEAPFLTSIGGNAILFESDNASYYNASLKTGIDYFHESLAKLGMECAGGENYAFKLFLKDFFISKTLKSHWAVKTFPPKVVADGLIKVFPEAKFIYIVRNGIDVVHSMTKYHGFRKNEFIQHCQVWDEGIKKYLYMKDLNSALCVRHEDLVSDPELFFKNIFSFLKLEHTPSSQHFVSTNLIHPLDQSNQTRKDILTQLRNRDNPFEYWTAEQKQIFISTCSESMKIMQYKI